jgi:predicted ATPase
VLVLLTYRSDEVNAALRHFLAELDRERLATEFVLTSLTTGEIDAMLKAIFGQSRPTRAEFLDAISEITEGNPFFIEEVLNPCHRWRCVSREGAWDRKPGTKDPAKHSRAYSVDRTG